MTITYIESADDLRADQLTGGFFEGWPKPPAPDEHLRILRGSTHVILAVEADAVVGFINAITDGVISAFIPLLEVLPSHRGRGIGTELTLRMLERCSAYRITDLVCDEHLVPFYERHGLVAARAMIRRKR
ncbi:MAG: GNAT family N-acetyltransferase [Planctomycetota bacterium]